MTYYYDAIPTVYNMTYENKYCTRSIVYCSFYSLSDKKEENLFSELWWRGELTAILSAVSHSSSSGLPCRWV